MINLALESIAASRATGSDMIATVNYHSSGDARESAPWTLVVPRRLINKEGK